jgi:hypothetical protein
MPSDILLLPSHPFFSDRARHPREKREEEEEQRWTYGRNNKIPNSILDILPNQIINITPLWQSMSESNQGI